MYDRILIPTDGSEYAEEAAQTAFELASTMDAAVHIISVVEPGPFGSVRLPGDGTNAKEVLTERAERYVSELEERATEHDLDVTTVVRTGVPVREILGYADEINGSVIVLGSRGRGGVSRMMLGSVTDAVTRQTGRDVLVVGDDAETNPEGEPS